MKDYKKKCKLLKLGANIQTQIGEFEVETVERSKAVFRRFEKPFPRRDIERGSYMPVNFFLLSDDKIEKGDWAYNSEVDSVYTFISGNTVYKKSYPAQGIYRARSAENPIYKDSLKVIASTDRSLGLPDIPNWVLEGYYYQNMDEFFVKYFIDQDSEGPISIYPDENEGVLYIESIQQHFTRDEVKAFAFKTAVEYSKGNIISGNDLSNWIEQNL